MGSMFTSRFTRRDSEGASALPEATMPAAEAAPTPPEVVEAKAAPDAGDPAPTTDASAVPPARLVEGEKKADRPDASEAKVRTAELLGWAKRYRTPATAAAALLLALGVGYGAGSAGQARDTGTAKALQALEKSTADLRQAHGQIGQLATELKSVKGTVEAMKGERDKARGELLSKQTQLSERMDKVGQENATRVGRIAEQLDRIEKAQRSAAEKTDRAEKGDKIAAAAPLPPAKPGLDPAHTGSISDGKTVEKLDPRKTPLEGYAVRDYDEGYALVETRAGRYIDVAVGTTLPGIGRVEAIERRGRQWVVITPKGFIAER